MRKNFQVHIPVKSHSEIRSMPHSKRRKKRCGRDCTLSVRHGPFCSNFSLRFSFQFNAVSVVNKPVKDGICQGGIGNASVPLGDRDLCGNQGGGISKAVIEDFQNILGILDGDSIRIQSSRTNRLHLARERKVLVREPSLRTWVNVCSKRDVRW